MLLRLDVVLHISILEVINVLFDHVWLMLIISILLSLSEIVNDLPQEESKFSILELDMYSILNDLFFPDISWCHFDSVMSIVLFGQSIIFISNSLLDQNILDFLSIFKGDIPRIVSISAIFVSEVD